MATQILRGSSDVTPWKSRRWLREGSVKPTATRVRGGRFRGEFEPGRLWILNVQGSKGPEHRLTSAGLDFAWARFRQDRRWLTQRSGRSAGQVGPLCEPRFATPSARSSVIRMRYGYSMRLTFVMTSILYSVYVVQLGIPRISNRCI